MMDVGIFQQKIVEVNRIIWPRFTSIFQFYLAISME